jgi:hypothetical protein
MRYTITPNTHMAKPEEFTTQKSQTGLIAQVIALHNQIIALRRSGTLITQQQNQLREYLSN